MQLLKFKSELSPPVVPSTELSQLVKISLHHPETYTHHFVQNRWDTLAHGGLPNKILPLPAALMHLCKPCLHEVSGCSCSWCVLWVCVVCVCCECCFISAFVRLFRSPPPRIRVKLDMWIFLIGLNAGKETSQTWDCSHRCSLLTLTLNKRGVKMSRLMNVMFWKGCEAADKVLCVSVRPSENFAAFCCLLHSGLSHRPQKFQASNKCPFQGHLCTRGHWGVKCWV